MTATTSGTNSKAESESSPNEGTPNATGSATTLRVVLIRHPFTIANAAGLLQGSTDSPLTQHGVQQMDHLCSHLPTDALLSSYFPPAAIFTSPLGRCTRLADSLASALAPALTPRHIAALEERDFGQLECTKKGIHGGPRFPKGVNGKKKENRDAFEVRVRSGFKECLKAACDAVASRAPSEAQPLIFIVTHGLWISTFARAFLGSTSPVPFADNTGMFVVDVSSGNKEDPPLITNVQLIKANYHPHLVGMARKQRGLSNLPDDGKQRKLSAFFGKRKEREEDQ